MDWAMSIRTLTAPEKQTLMVLAYYADKFSVCRPSVQRLVKETGLGQSTIYRNLQTLEERGLITSWKSAKTNIYVLHTRPVKVLTEGDFPTAGAKPLGSTTSSTEGGDRSYLQTSSEGPFRPQTPSASTKPKTTRRTAPTSRRPKPAPKRTKVHVARSESAAARGRSREELIESGLAPELARPGIRRVSWEEAREIIKHTTRRRKETPMPADGFEKPEMTPRQRREAEAAERNASYGGSGQLPEQVEAKEAAKVAKKRKHWEITPVQDWSCADLKDYLRHRASAKTPHLLEQVPAGWALGDFNRWLKEDIPAEVIRDTIDRFFADDRNFRGGSANVIVWRRFRTYFLQRYPEAMKKHARAARKPKITKVEDSNATEPFDPRPTKSVEDPLRGHPLEKYLRAELAKEAVR